MLNRSKNSPLPAITRRRFLAVTIKAGALGAISGPILIGHADASEFEAYEGLEGMAALVDTVLPGCGSDPQRLPGALEAGALELINDPYFGVEQYLSLLRMSVNLSSFFRYFRRFASLNLEQRTKVVATLERLVPEINLFFKFVRLAYYSAPRSDVGFGPLDYNGPNLGYIDHPDMSFRKPVSLEMTDEGNLP